MTEGNSKKQVKKHVLFLEAGGWAREHWIERVLPDFKDKLEVAGLVDINKAVLKNSGKVLGLRQNRLFTSMDEAFDKVSADFCVIVLPPYVHKKAVMLAVEKNTPVLSEKPITDRYEDTIEVYKSVMKKHLKMAVIQNYRYESIAMTLKKILQEGKLGEIDYIIARYASDYRQSGLWDVTSAYKGYYPLLVEGSIHHFDMIRNLSGANCKSIFCTIWNPKWSNFKNTVNSLTMLEMTNGVKAIYEENTLAAGCISPWHQEYYRVECEKGSVVVNGGDHAVRVYTRSKFGRKIIKEIPPVPTLPTGHHQILSDFLAWLDGGEIPETALEKNIHSALMVFAAITAKEKNQPQLLKDYLPDNYRI